MKYLSGREARLSSFPFFYPQTQERESNLDFASCTPPVCCAYFDSMGRGRICKFRVLDAYEQTKRTKPWRPCFLLEEEALSSDQFKFCLPHGISFQKFALSDWQHLKSILWQNWFSISSGEDGVSPAHLLSTPSISPRNSQVRQDTPLPPKSFLQPIAYPYLIHFIFPYSSLVLYLPTAPFLGTAFPH